MWKARVGWLRFGLCQFVNYDFNFVLGWDSKYVLYCDHGTLTIKPTLTEFFNWRWPFQVCRFLYWWHVCWATCILATRKPTTKTENQSEVIEEWCALYLAGPLKTNDLENLCTNRENLCTNLKTLHKRPWRNISPAAPHRLFILSPRFQTTVAWCPPTGRDHKRGRGWLHR